MVSYVTLPIFFCEYLKINFPNFTLTFAPFWIQTQPRRHLVTNNNNVPARTPASMQTAILYIMAQDRSTDATHARPPAHARAPSHALRMLHPDAAHTRLSRLVFMK